MCARSSATLEPMFGTGKPCSKKFVVSLAVRSGQVSLHQSNKLLCALFFLYKQPFLFIIATLQLQISFLLQKESGAIYANIKFVENKTGHAQRREQLAKPFRISVTKSDVHVVYPLKYLHVSELGIAIVKLQLDVEH